MLEPILQGLREVEGVQGTMLIDGAATVLAHRAHTIYDVSVLQQVARSVVSTVDAVQLIQDDWDVLTAHFADGKLLLRHLRITGAKPRTYVLVVIADSSLNVAFLGVALRVAASKLIAELEAGPPAPSVVPAASASAPPVRAPAPAPAAPPARPEMARTGLSWSAGSTASTTGSAVGGYSDVTVSDSASSTFLTACTKALGASVGPMAKVFVMEAVRKLCGDRMFSRADGPALLAHLAAVIDDGDERTRFQRATRAL